MYRVYGDMLSGNCYKIKLLMQFLQIEHEWKHVDILAGETHTEEFVAMNSNARIPVLQIDAKEFLAESNAILNFLAEGTPFLPESGLPRARVLQWQFFEQYSHEPFIAVARFIQKFLGMPAERAEEFHAKQAGGNRALDIMERQLSETPFIAGAVPTIADISLYAYTHVADEGGFDLGAFAKIRRWLASIESLPHYVAMARENA